MARLLVVGPGGDPGGARGGGGGGAGEVAAGGDHGRVDGGDREGASRGGGRGGPAGVAAATDRALAEAIGSARGAGRLAPVTVVAASPYAALFLRQRWGRAAPAPGVGAAAGGFVNVRFTTLGGLAAALGGPSLAAAGRRPLTPAIERAAVRLAVGRDARHEGVLAVFRRLRGHAPYAAPPEGSTYERGAGPAARYPAYREIVSGHFDAHDLALSAAAAVAAGSPAAAGIGTVVAHLPGAVSGAEAELLHHLAGADRLRVVLALTGDPEADAAVEAMIDRFRAVLGPPHRRPARPAGPSPRLAGLPAADLIVSAPDPEEEIREAVRLMIARAEAADVPFHRMAILFADPEPHATIASQVLAEAGIPQHGPGPSRLADSAAGRILSGLLDLAVDGLDRGRVAGWLAAAPVVDPATGRPAPAHRWDRLSRRTGASAPGRWIERIGAQVAAADRADAAALARFVGRLGADLRPPAGDWTGLARWAGDLLASYAGPAEARAAWPGHERDALDRVHERVEALGRVDEVGAPAAVAAFRDEVAEELAAPARAPARFGEGLFVGPLGAAVGAVFDMVAVVGMAEGRFPPRRGPDPFLGGPDPDAPPDPTRLHYATVVGSAGRAVVSYSRGDPRSGRRMSPCPWLLEAAAVHAGHPVGADDLLGSGSAPWLRIVASSESTLRSSLPASSPAEAELRSLHRWKAAGRPLAAHPLTVREPALAAGLEMVHARASHRLTRFDGLAGRRAGPAGGGAATTGPDGPTGVGATVSATALERWAGCPFRSFLHDVLRVQEVERPEERAGFGGADRGVLVHAVLAELIATTPPRRTPSEAWTADERIRAREIAERLCAEHEERSPSDPSPAWEVEKRRIVRSTLAFLDADEEVRRSLGVIPSPEGVEVGFGRTGDPLAGPVVATPAGPVTLHGRLDRIDRSPDGRRVVVHDYKTGRSTGGDPAEGLSRGTRIQLAAYAAAAAGVGPEVEEVSAYYWAVGPGSEGREARTGFALDADIRRRLREAVGTVTGAIAGGIHPAIPDDPAGPARSESPCRLCRYQRVCAANRGAPWRTKATDPAARPYLELAGGAA